MKVAVLGGTGSFGRALAARLVVVGEDEIVIGSRDAERAVATAAELGGNVSGATNEDAVHGVELAVLAVNADAALDTARSVAGPLGATPLLCVASAISFEKGRGMLPDPAALSLAERVQELVDAPVAAGLHSVAASNLENAPDEDALVCGDDETAKALALELAGRLVGGRALDVGPLASARALEGLTAVIVNVNRRYKAHAGIRVTGVGSTEPAKSEAAGSAGGGSGQTGVGSTEPAKSEGAGSAGGGSGQTGVGSTEPAKSEGAGSAGGGSG